MNTNNTTGINQATEAVAAAAATANDLELRRRRADKIKAGAIGTAKAVGYMAVGVGLTIGVQKLQSKRQDQQQGQ